MRIKINCFNPYVIADSGQCFRMKMIDEKICHLIAKDKFLEIEKISNNEYDFSCDKKTFDSFGYSEDGVIRFSGLKAEGTISDSLGNNSDHIKLIDNGTNKVYKPFIVFDSVGRIRFSNDTDDF